jgi:hypothetical protein
MSSVQLTARVRVERPGPAHREQPDFGNAEREICAGFAPTFGERLAPCVERRIRSRNSPNFSEGVQPLMPGKIVQTATMVMEQAITSERVSDNQFLPNRHNTGNSRDFGRRMRKQGTSLEAEICSRSRSAMDLPACPSSVGILSRPSQRSSAEDFVIRLVHDKASPFAVHNAKSPST